MKVDHLSFADHSYLAKYVCSSLLGLRNPSNVLSSRYYMLTHAGGATCMCGDVIQKSTVLVHMNMMLRQ